MSAQFQQEDEFKARLDTGLWWKIFQRALHFKRYLIPLAIAASNAAFACSCFGPQTFCGTLNPQPPQFPDPQWWIPSDIIMAVKVNSVEYGADMKVVQTFSGTLQAEQVIRVWGDCGLLCRHYVDGVANGDTVIWALQHCDLSGNGACGTSFEQAGDYQLSVCGICLLYTSPSPRD